MRVIEYYRMKLLPFLVSAPYNVKMLEHNVSVYRIAFLLDSAKNIWDESEVEINSVEKSCLAPNEITPFKKKSWKTIDDILYIPINNQVTQIQNFVLYEEEPKHEGLIWRTFYYFLDTDHNKSFLDKWNYPGEYENMLSNALKVWSVK